MGRRIALGVLAGGIYVWLTGVAYDFASRMRDHATDQFSARPLVIGSLALVGVGIVTAFVTLQGRRLPAMLWTAGFVSLMLIPLWGFVPWYPDPMRTWAAQWPLGLEGSSLLAGLMLTLAVHATWFTESPDAAPTDTAPR